MNPHTIKDIIRKKGTAPIINAISAIYCDLKRAGYSMNEIKDEIECTFLGFDKRIDIYIKGLK